jgi:hypothetical protein
MDIERMKLLLESLEASKQRHVRLWDKQGAKVINEKIRDLKAKINQVQRDELIGGLS